LGSQKLDRLTFRSGLKSGLSVALGYIPIGVTYGLLARSTGLSLLETEMISLTVYAGASQFIALNLVAMGSGALQIITAVFLVNIRHLLMSASLSRKVKQSPLALKLIYSFGITDETFAVASMEEGKISSSYMLGLNSLAYTSWAFNSALGYLLGGQLPLVMRESMAVALYALFIGLLVPPMKENSKVVALAGTAAGLNCLFRPLISSGWSIALATVSSALFIEIADRYQLLGFSKKE